MGFKESISKSIGKANDFVTDKQRKFRLQQSLDKESVRLSALFIELGKVHYYGSPIVSGRTSQVIKDDITTCINAIETLKQELTGELIEYKICREMAEKLSQMTDGFKTFTRAQEQLEFDNTYDLVHEADVLYAAYMSAAGRGMRKLPPPATAFTKIVAKKIVAVSTKIVFVMRRLVRGGKQKISTLFSSCESRSELVATFLAVLELCKANRIEINTDKPDAEITIRREHNEHK